MKNDIVGYFVNDNYSFTIKLDKNGKRTGKLVDMKTGTVLADNLQQRVMPESIEGLLNVAKVIISAAWQDGKILPSEREAFNNAFKNIDFSERQRLEIEKEFETPTPVEELVKKISTREEKLLILETSLLLIIADNEFHPKEREFIDFLVKKFKLESNDFALLYNILPGKVKRYIEKEKIHETLSIKEDEIKTLKRLQEKQPDVTVNHEKVYYHFVDSWKNRSTRYKRTSVF
ncbi:MAG: TerB family tellurite resistance protein [Candidatus Cloacimonetes bacterium]|nr:TerB family tellurite resistance protein [Candidatus Cloacimonadota bacterium]